MLKLEHLTQAHLDQINLPLPMTMRAGVAVLEGDTVLGVGGYVVGPDRILVCSQMTLEARARLTCTQYKRALLMAARHVLRQAIAARIPIEATADDVPHAHAFLAHLGFIKNDYGRYSWAGCQ